MLSFLRVPSLVILVTRVLIRLITCHLLAHFAETGVLLILELCGKRGDWTEYCIKKMGSACNVRFSARNWTYKLMAVKVCIALVQRYKQVIFLKHSCLFLLWPIAAKKLDALAQVLIARGAEVNVKHKKCGAPLGWGTANYNPAMTNLLWAPEQRVKNFWDCALDAFFLLAIFFFV